MILYYDKLVDSIPGMLPPKDSSNSESIDPQKPDLIFMTDLIITKYHSDVMAAESADGQVCCVATGIYNKHRIYLDQWNPWYPFDCAYDFQQAQSLYQNSRMWTNQHLKHGLDDFRIESFQSASKL